MAQQRMHTRRVVLAFGLAGLCVAPGFAQANGQGGIANFVDLRSYLLTAAQMMSDLGEDIRGTRDSGALTPQDIQTLTWILDQTETLTSEKSGNTDFLMDFAIVARDESASETALNARWREAGSRLERSSMRLARVVSIASESSAFAQTLGDEGLDERFFALSAVRQGIMTSLIDSPRPQTEAELLALEEAVLAWRELIAAAELLNREIAAIISEF